MFFLDWLEFQDGGSKPRRNVSDFTGLHGDISHKTLIFNNKFTVSVQFILREPLGKNKRFINIHIGTNDTHPHARTPFYVLLVLT
jgi:hypothetical protein